MTTLPEFTRNYQEGTELKDKQQLLDEATLAESKIQFHNKLQ